MFGKIHSDESKQKMPLFQKGHNSGKSHIEIFGELKSEEIKSQIAKSNSERIWTEESKLKLSVSQKQRRINSPESFNIGIPKTTEHKKNISISKKEKFKKSDNISYNWIHDIHGKFIGTRSELKDKFPSLKMSEITKVIDPKYKEKSYRGWSII